VKLLRNLYYFIKNPKSYKKEQANFISVLKEFIVYDLFITFSWAFLIGITSFLVDDFALVFRSKKKLNETSDIIFLITVFLAPLIEELAYRLSLKIDKITISVSLSVQFIIYLHLLKLIDAVLYVRIILMIIFSFLFYFTISKKLSEFLNKKFNVYLYFNLLSFTIIHALNFSYFEVYHYLFIPILTSLQFFFGLYLSYVRLKLGFLYVLGFHIIHNS
jgi:hypothetical protein